MAEQFFRHGPPSSSGRIPFTPPGTDLKCETKYWLWGDLSTGKVPLIVLHGGPGAPGRDWKAITILSKSHEIPMILYDQIGCGESTHLRDMVGGKNFWTMDLFLAELENLKAHLKITTYDVLGHSCGGMIAVSHTLTQPKGLRKLVIASSAASETLRATAQREQRSVLPQHLQDAMTAYEVDDKPKTPECDEAFMILFKRHLCVMNPWPEEISETVAQMEADDTVSATLYTKNQLAGLGTWAKYDVQPRLHEITGKTVPGGVLLTNGKFDMTPDKVMAPFFNKIQAKVKWVRFGLSSHMAQLEEMDSYNAVLGDFLTTE